MTLSDKGIKLLIALLMVVAIVFVVIIFSDSLASGDTIIVAKDEGGENENIKEAIDAAEDGHEDDSEGGFIPVLCAAFFIGVLT